LRSKAFFILLIVLISGFLIPLSYAIPTQRDFYLQAGVAGQTGIYGAEWRTQSFTASSGTDYIITHVILRLCKSASSPNTLKVHIRETDNGADISTGTIDANTFSTYPNFNWYTITLSSAVIQEGHTYWIVLDAHSSSGTDSVYWRGDMNGDGAYSGGHPESSTNSGSTWTDILNNDLYFEVWGNDSNYVTVSYLPNDSPMLKQKNYNFKFQCFTQAVATQGLIFNLNVNGVDNGNYTAGASGIKYIVFYFSTVGVKNFTINLYSADGEEDLGITELSYTVSENPEGGGINMGGLLNSGSVLFTGFIPLFLILITPVLIFSRFGGAGMVIGLGVGTIIGTLTGFLPFYVIFILLLLIAIAIVMLFRGGISSNPQGEG